MVVTKKVASISALKRLNQLAYSVPEEVTISSLDGRVSTDAKSPMGLFTLDYSAPVQITTDAPEILLELARW